MTPPTRFRFLIGTLKGAIFQNNHGKMPQYRYPVPFFQPGWFRYLIGGVMTPPYETNRLIVKLQFAVLLSQADEHNKIYAFNWNRGWATRLYSSMVSTETSVPLTRFSGATHRNTKLPTPEMEG